MLNSQSLVVYFKNIDDSSIQVRQQWIRCNYTNIELKIPIFFGYVLNFPRVSNFDQFYHRNDREQNGTFTGMCGALWKTYQ